MQLPAENSSRICVDGKFLSSRGQRLRVKGVTYGPFAPDSDNEPLPPPSRVVQDLAKMAAAHINAVRLYHVPPEWFLERAHEHQIRVFIDIPWPRHLCFLEDPQTRKDIQAAVRKAVVRCRQFPSVLAYSIGNEIPPSIVRWYGAPRVERFLAELQDLVKEADPHALVTYANYPSTEYLDLSFLDFLTFNVYLANLETFRRYLFRLQNLAGDKPLVLGEVGLDTLRNGAPEQARFLAGHLGESLLTGAAGVFVFSWTDDWFTGGHQIRDWAFGITDEDGIAKPSFGAVGEIFGSRPAQLLSARPRVSVVVCSYNGAATLDQCLRSLGQLDYPDYEVIVVDDGSTDRTREILRDHLQVRAIHQPNLGLSAARNAGLRAATGSVIAYIDSDCYADPDWLTHLVHRLATSSAAGVGGPNLSPEDGRVAACSRGARTRLQHGFSPGSARSDQRLRSALSQSRR
jgi:hypothetical protein